MVGNDSGGGWRRRRSKKVNTWQRLSLMTLGSVAQPARSRRQGLPTPMPLQVESHGPGILPKFNSTSRTLLHLLHSNHNNLSYQENRREQPNSCILATLDDFSNTSSLFGIESIFANLSLELIAPTLAASKDLDNVGPTVLTDDPG